MASRALEEAQDHTSDLQAQGYTRQSNGLLIPHSRLDGVDAKVLAEAKRDLTTAAASGGNLISDDVRGDIFIEALRNNMVLGDMVTMLTEPSGERDLSRRKRQHPPARGELRIKQTRNPTPS